jgi:nucleoside-diphosphate-sugar epimerase
LVYPAVNKRDQFYSLSEASVEKGDLIRLQDVNLNYTFNELHLCKKQLQSVQLYVYASNFGLIWRANKKGLDPDYGTATPPSFSISFGHKTTF